MTKLPLGLTTKTKSLLRRDAAEVARSDEISGEQSCSARSESEGLGSNDIGSRTVRYERESSKSSVAKSTEPS
jgi:hypothetical protein